MTRREELIDALRALVRDGHGCRFCDSGKLRNPSKGHDPECGYVKAEKVLSMNLNLTLIHDAPAHRREPGEPFELEPCETLPKGTPCKYVAHVVGGMVLVRMPDGRERVIHPATTKELS